MSKKNSSVNLKNGFKEFKDLSKIFSNFKSKLNSTNKKNWSNEQYSRDDAWKKCKSVEKYKNG